MNDPSSKKEISFYKRLSNYASRIADSIKMRENSFVLTVAVFIGMIGGFGAVGILQDTRGGRASGKVEPMAGGAPRREAGRLSVRL